MCSRLLLSLGIRNVNLTIILWFSIDQRRSAVFIKPTQFNKSFIKIQTLVSIVYYLYINLKARLAEYKITFKLAIVRLSFFLSRLSSNLSYCIVRHKAVADLPHEVTLFLETIERETSEWAVNLRKGKHSGGGIKFE